jgi:hypothetical protein
MTMMTMMTTILQQVTLKRIAVYMLSDARVVLIKLNRPVSQPSIIYICTHMCVSE